MQWKKINFLSAYYLNSEIWLSLNWFAMLSCTNGCYSFCMEINKWFIGFFFLLYFMKLSICISVYSQPVYQWAINFINKSVKYYNFEAFMPSLILIFTTPAAEYQLTMVGSSFGKSVEFV